MTPGTRLGPYEIVAPLGAGGMGEVYRARDTRLGRDVAIKVLPSAVASDPERRARFEREAQLLASLNHPHIAAIHGVEEAGGLTALVLEFVDGVTLDGRIGAAGISIDEALPIARQIVDALEAAHERGIVHRDLKPANIKVRPDGTVKVLDFGLAKALDPVGAGVAGGVGSASISPTLTSPVTMAGTILGTAAYMSPEQAKGRGVDKRSDIWAFGAVLYEMLTGRRAFPGEDITDTIVAVMSKEPDWTRLPASTPPGVVRLLHRCLNKDRRERLRDIGDARFELTDTGVSTPASQTPATARPRALEWTAAAVVGAAIAIAAVWPRLQKPPAPPEVRMDIVIAGGESVPFVAVSRDGRSIAFVTLSTSDRSVLWTRSISGAERHRVEGADGAAYPFWSPDGESIGFFQDNRLKIVAASGGPVQTLCDAPTGRGASWNSDGTIVFNAINEGPLYRVAASGGPCTPLTTIDAARGDLSHRFPFWLPDAEHFLFTAFKKTSDPDDLYVASLKGGPPARVLTNASNTSYVNGFLVFVRGGTLLAQRFDVRTLRTSGEPVRVTTENPVYRSGARFAHFSAASTTIAWVPDAPARSRLVFVDRSGRELGGIAEPDDFRNFSLSRDGTRAAVVKGTSDQGNIWIYERQRGQLTRLTTRTGSHSSLALSPDGQTLAFSLNPGSGFNIFLRAADGSGEDREVFHSALWQQVTGWSADGKLLMYQVADPKTGSDIWYAAMDGSTKPTSFLQTPFAETGARPSPNGKWIAYESDETGRSEAYVREFPSGRDKRKVSSNGSGLVRWSDSGRELFILTPAGVAVVPVAQSANGLEIGLETKLFERRINYFDVSGSGTEFLINVPEPAPPSRIVVSVGWLPSVAAR